MKTPSNVIKVLALWNIGLLLYFLWQVKFVEARYILMLVPSMIVLASVFFLQCWKWASNARFATSNRHFLQFLLIILAVFILGVGGQQWWNWSDYHRNREYTTASVIGGKWLADNASNSLTIIVTKRATCIPPNNFPRFFEKNNAVCQRFLNFKPI